MSKARRVAIPLLLAAAAAARVAAQPFDPSSYSGMRWRMAGPFRGGRALAVALVPGQPNHFYFGAVGGGEQQRDRDATRFRQNNTSSNAARLYGACDIATHRPRRARSVSSRPSIKKIPADRNSAPRDRV